MQLPLLRMTWQRLMLSKRFSRTPLASKLMPPRYFRLICFYLLVKAFCVVDCNRLYFINSVAINCWICSSMLSVYDRALPWCSWGFGSYCHCKSHNNRMAASINQSICKFAFILWYSGLRLLSFQVKPCYFRFWVIGVGKRDVLCFFFIMFALVLSAESRTCSGFWYSAKCQAAAWN